MMWKWVTLLLFVLVCGDNPVNAAAHNPFVCCHQKNETAHTPPKKAWSLVNAILHSPSQCNHTNVALAYFNTTKGYKQVSCVNGFGLMSFCLALFDRLLTINVRVADQKFYDELLGYKRGFAAQFSKATTDSSGFKNNLELDLITTRHGRMASKTHVAGLTRSSASSQL
ncbi:ORF47 [Alcelaphine gammaherpesvirus 1]|uniref:Envelope glycoprotein L n=1 Tax=Alcelaphine herpesvirus 1 (strain C500) TaxID=654901 RepID=GL_ALHV1|nr:ORF47 [Alcelaphine gammaherpesvirus 1]O36396.1 RecName: Full=Envelope glycoprotein L; Short=gL; Flags: Precursor [Alcelaphine herpesvirus 1 strain C500]AAC58093.1 ORF47 [Alcelaphine gammaherpesvirus 1]APB09471.1 envelope glycoprotein L [Alcelaphine gammaherpesvirus 1]APB09543.1 envelope glycoprotein L [Alcelaphine gammaherpesvirus 1]ATI21934.1 ORF47 [Alcelaphine gammaherpesvirus 1]QDY92280.1 envelope glycoprotein L [Alcelaphine gammaherpesvirus 1]